MRIYRAYIESFKIFIYRIITTHNANTSCQNLNQITHEYVVLFFVWCEDKLYCWEKKGTIFLFALANVATSIVRRKIVRKTIRIHVVSRLSTNNMWVLHQHLLSESQSQKMESCNEYVRRYVSLINQKKQIIRKSVCVNFSVVTDQRKLLPPMVFEWSQRGEGAGEVF